MMTTKRGLGFALILCSIAVLYQVEVVTTRWEAEDFAIVPTEPMQLWKFLTNTDTIDKWFQWVSMFRAVDGRPLGRGKRFEAGYSVPLLGEYAMGLQVVEYVPNRRLVLESESLLKPRFTLSVEAYKADSTKLNVKLGFKRNSALFRCTLGPLMWLLSSQQLRHSLFLIKMIFPA